MTTAPTNATAPSYRGLFAVPSIGRLMLGSIIARTASSMTGVVLVLFTLTQFHSAELAGFVTFMSLAPGILISPLVGALLDRHGRTRLVLLDYLLAAGATFAIAALSVLNLLSAPVLVLVAVVLGLAWPLGTVGLRSLVPLIVPRELWGRANAVDSNGYVVATLIGPPVAGALVGLGGGAVALVVVGALYLVACVVMVGIPDPPTPFDSRGRLLSDAVDGIRYVLRNRTLRGLGVGLSVWNIGGGIFQILVPVLLINQLGQGPALVGLAWAVSGVGALIAALFVGRIDFYGHERSIIVWGLVGTAIATALLLAQLQVWLVVAVIGLIGLLNGPMDVGMFTLRQRRTDLAWVGRAFSVSMSLNFAGYPVGAALGGLIVSRSIELAIVVGVAAALVSAFTIWRLVPRHDEMDLA